MKIERKTYLGNIYNNKKHTSGSRHVMSQAAAGAVATAATTAGVATFAISMHYMDLRKISVIYIKNKIRQYIPV